MAFRPIISSTQGGASDDYFSLFSTYSGPGSTYLLFLILTAALQGRCSYSHFTDKELEAQEV